MADVYNKMMHESEEKDELRRYLMSEIIRIFLLKKKEVNLNAITLDLLCKPTKEFISIHSSVSRDLEQFLQQNGFNR